MTHLHDLPDALIRDIYLLISDSRARNSAALVCRKWRLLERSTRYSLSLRGNVRDPSLLPNCFSSVSHLDLSLLSPWGHPFLHPDHPSNHTLNRNNDYSNFDEHLLLPHRLRQAFPAVTSLTVYARHPSTLQALAPRWPNLNHAKLVRWHQRPHHPPGSDLIPLLAACPNLTSLDLSQFYCWTEDIPQALQSNPRTSANLTSLNLLSASAADGFRAEELLSIATACPNLRHLLAPCVFNPRYIDFITNDTLLALSNSCPRLSLLHLADPAAYSSFASPPYAGTGSDGYAPEDSRLIPVGLGRFFARLPLLEDVSLELCHNVRDAGPAFEALGNECSKLRSLKLNCFHSVCIAGGLHLDGVALCGGLESLSIKNSADLSDASLVTIARGCRRLSKFEIQGCKRVTVTGLKRMAGMLRRTLVDVRISGCDQFTAATSLCALEPICDRIQRLHIDCIWVRPGVDHSSENYDHITDHDYGEDVDEFDIDNGSQPKRLRYSEDGAADGSLLTNGISCFWLKSWEKLQYLSLWFPAGEVLSPLVSAGLVSCPELEEISIKIEGDCRACSKPMENDFGLSTLLAFPKLTKMKLDCGEAIGYALTAPMGQMDLSLWERFYLHGIGDLSLYELDYWPPQDKEVNQRTLSLPATALLQGCLTLRKLFIHGTANEHFMSFFLMMENLRDVQLREDYYPAPEYDMSTEMRVESCSRFEDKLNHRQVPD